MTSSRDLRRIGLSLLVVLLVSTAVCAADKELSFTISYWSRFNWYGLYTAYGEKDPKVDEAVFNAAIHLRRDRKGEAVAELKRITQDGCSDPTVLLMYGYALYESGMRKEASSVLRKGAQTCQQEDRPEWVRTWVRGACLQWHAYSAVGQNRFLDGLKACQSALAAYPKCPTRDALAANIPWVENMAKREKEADDLAAGIRDDLNAPDAKEKMVQALEKLIPPGIWHKADRLSSLAIKKWPEDARVMYQRLRVLKGLKRYHEAEAIGIRAIQAAERADDLNLLFDVIREQYWTAWKDWHADRTPQNKKRIEQLKIPQLVARLLDLAERLDDDDKRYLAMFIRADLYEVYIERHQWQKAIDHFEKAFAMAKKHNWAWRIRNCKVRFAEVYACMGNFEESLKWSKEAGTGPHPFVKLRRKNWSEIYRQKKFSIERLEEETLRQPTERLQRQIVGWNQRHAYDNFILACVKMGKHAEAIETVERFHNRTLGVILGARIAEGKDLVVTRKKQQHGALQEKIKSLQTKLAAANKRKDTNAVTSIQRDLTVQSTALQQIGCDIEADELEIGARKKPTRMSVKDMQALLDDDTALIMYFAEWSPYMYEGVIAVITKEDVTGMARHKLEIGTYEGDGVQPRINGYLAALLRRPKEGDTKAGLRKYNDELYELLLEPIREHSKNKRHLIIIPSGPLCLIPFHLLRNPAGRYLIQDHTISYAQSAGVLKYCLGRNRQLGRDVTVVANPALPERGYSLKFAEVEAAAVQQVYPDADILVGAAATETAVKDALPTPGILHFACHGLLNTEFPMRSALALARDEKNDGMLTAREVCDYDVRAGLVTLSACESGSGKMSAGWIELVGMTRAWMLAGAPSVVVSLWKLDDRATSELMAEFYKNLRTMSRAEALQRAQLAMMKRYENPYYWGAFALYGDYR